MEKTNLQKKGIASYWLVAMFMAISFGIAFITSGILFFLQAPALEPTFEKTAKKWEDRIVKIECSDAQSTGFIMESKKVDGKNYLYIVTTEHGVRYSSYFATANIDGNYYSLEPLSLNADIDVAIFRFEYEGNYTLPTVDNVSVAEEVMAIGFPRNESLTTEVGYVNKTAYVDENSSLSALLCYDVSAYVQSGMSGCPILSKDGKLIGIGARTKVGNISGEQVIFSSDNYIVPAKILFAEYDRVTNHKTKPSAKYSVSLENGSIVVSVADKKAVFQNDTLTIDGKKVEKVANKNVENVIDFVEQISYYENRNSNGEVKVQLEDGELYLRVINE